MFMSAELKFSLSKSHSLCLFGNNENKVVTRQKTDKGQNRAEREAGFQDNSAMNLKLAYLILSNIDSSFQLSLSLLGISFKHHFHIIQDC